MYPAKTILALAMVSFVNSAAASAACTRVDFDEGNTVTEIAEKKIEYAIAAIADVENQKKDASCVAANMRYLGLAHSERAIPTLISLLAFHIAPDPHRFNDPAQYPAIGALRNIGQPALPALMEVLANKENDTTESKNALDVFMDIDAHRGNLDKGLKRLKRAAQKETDPVRAARLRRAIEDARARWCRFSPCTE